MAAAAATTNEEASVQEPGMADELVSYGQMAAFSFIGSPFTVVRTLIQLGYEPVSEQVSKNIFGQLGYRRASFFTFCKLIYRRKGFMGLFVGWQPRIIETLLEKISREYAGRLLWPAIGPAEGDMIKELEGATAPSVLLHEIAVDSLCGVASVLVCHPFYVVGCRMIAEHVGGDGIYTGLVSSVSHIVETEGFAGFYGGIVPAMLQEVAYVTAITLMSHAIRQTVLYITNSQNVHKDQKRLIHFLSHSLALTMSGPFFFPFKTVKTIMAVNGTKLAAGRPPFVPLFKSWTDCFTYLYELNGFGSRGLLRGSSNFRRFYGKALPTPTF